MLANGMGAHLGTLMSVSNQFSAPQFNGLMFGGGMGGGGGAHPVVQPLDIEPHQVSRQATVTAVFAIE